MEAWKRYEYSQAIYELVKTLPEEQASLVLVFTRFVQQQGKQNFSQAVPLGTLTGLRGAKPVGDFSTDLDVAADSTNYLIWKYQ
ncbi:DUF2281 domain-containing protein [Phormidium sp. FACHB-322]|uniref:DUF2281 domain-containing protein n=1 Tax=Cyanophyceae TaxID=3028117 RepID=UPI001683B521|nr:MULTISPECIES: DUF2281 domain-containing protein [Cyanophyceae]MBD1916956.1 DUF2281 domain-containing protein [Phormidium sp. FACHB-77]MBD2029807.1 DUF2281 domain-containing protein [Phormidium sp. FACHB-322]MBD2050405.1 DUF2281 domain-containing protein [Leptolyngbya sp. FACHB-60]